MTSEEFDPSTSVDPPRDRELGAALARFESTYATSQTAVARQRYRIGVAVRRQAKERLLESPTWMEWTASAARRPIPFGIAAALLIAAACAIVFKPYPVETVLTASTNMSPSLSTVVASGATSAQIMDVLIAPTTSDSLLAAAFALPVTSRP